MKPFDVILDGKRYCGMYQFSEKNEYAAVWTTIWYGEKDVDKFRVTPSMISQDNRNFWNRIFSNQSDGTPTQLELGLE